MAKLINRTSDRTLKRRMGEPAFQPWSPWEVCEGTEGLGEAELKRLASEWHRGEQRTITGSGAGWKLSVRTPYEREEYMVVPDDFDVDNYNQRLSE